MTVSEIDLPLIFIGGRLGRTRFIGSLWSELLGKSAEPVDQSRNKRRRTSSLSSTVDIARYLEKILTRLERLGNLHQSFQRCLHALGTTQRGSGNADRQLKRGSDSLPRPINSISLPFRAVVKRHFDQRHLRRTFAPHLLISPAI
jgi:Ni,Fe-hydrogenase III large subunit